LAAGGFRGQRGAAWASSAVPTTVDGHQQLRGEWVGVAPLAPSAEKLPPVRGSGAAWERGHSGGTAVTSPRQSALAGGPNSANQALPRELHSSLHSSRASTCQSFDKASTSSLQRSLTEDSFEKEVDREEWRNHLQRSVTQKLEDEERSWRSTWKGSCASPLRGGVEGSGFQGTCATVILVNAAFLGYTSNESMSKALENPPGEDPAWFTAAHSAFTAFYCFEITCRLSFLRKGFFTGPDWRWNVFDVILVLVSLMEVLVQDIGLGSLRVIRGLRMFRVLRIMRLLRFFRDLRLMVCMILQSLWSLSWALLLLIIIMYLFSIVFMQGAVMCFRGDDEPSNAFREGVLTWYGTMMDTMFTLLAGITGGEDWLAATRPLHEISAVYPLLFAFYIVFVVIGVLNVLTGIFVERAQELSGLDKDLVIQTELKRNENFLVEMRRVFEEADADHSGTISWTEFRGYLKNDRVKAYLATQQLDAFDARTLFDILNVGADEEISLDKFIVGCMRLKGMARSVDVVAVLQETRSVSRRLKALMREFEQHAAISFSRGPVAPPAVAGPG